MLQLTAKITERQYHLHWTPTKPRAPEWEILTERRIFIPEYMVDRRYYLINPSGQSTKISLKEMEQLIKTFPSVKSTETVEYIPHEPYVRYYTNDEDILMKLANDGVEIFSTESPSIDYEDLVAWTSKAGRIIEVVSKTRQFKKGEEEKVKQMKSALIEVYKIQLRNQPLDIRHLEKKVIDFRHTVHEWVCLLNTDTIYTEES